MRHAHHVSHLLHADGRFPPLVLVQDAQTDGAGGEDVGMEQRRLEHACGTPPAVSAPHRQHMPIPATARVTDTWAAIRGSLQGSTSTCGTRRPPTTSRPACDQKCRPSSITHTDTYPLLAGNAALPHHDVQRAVFLLGGTGLGMGAGQNTYWLPPRAARRTHAQRTRKVDLCATFCARVAGAGAPATKTTFRKLCSNPNIIFRPP